MTVLFLRVPWETGMPFQIGDSPGPSLPKPTSPHTEPAMGCWHTVPTTEQNTTSTNYLFPACLGGSRLIKPGQMCTLGWKTLGIGYDGGGGDISSQTSERKLRLSVHR